MNNSERMIKKRQHGMHIEKDKEGQRIRQREKTERERHGGYGCRKIE